MRMGRGAKQQFTNWLLYPILLDCYELSFVFTWHENSDTVTLVAYVAILTLTCRPWIEDGCYDEHWGN